MKYTCLLPVDALSAKVSHRNEDKVALACWGRENACPIAPSTARVSGTKRCGWKLWPGRSDAKRADDVKIAVRDLYLCIAVI